MSDLTFANELLEELQKEVDDSCPFLYNKFQELETLGTNPDDRDFIANFFDVFITTISLLNKLTQCLNKELESKLYLLKIDHPYFSLPWFDIFVNNYKP